MKKATFTLLLMLLVAGLALVLTTRNVYAMPCSPENNLITQPNGTQFVAQTWGDELTSGFETPEGYSINQQADGWWTYITPDQNNGNSTLSSVGSLRVAVDNPPAVELHLERNFKLASSLPLSNPLCSSTPELSPASPLEDSFNAELSASLTGTNIGTQSVLVILGYYDDRPQQTLPSDFQTKFFGSSKSIRDYYSQASYGLFSLTPAAESSGTVNDGIVGWVNLGKTHPDPSNQDWNATLNIASSALQAANPYVDFAAFDKDGNKGISASELHVVLVIAGYEASYDGGIAQPAVWGHKWSISTSVVNDGVTVCSPSFKGSYTMFGEMMGDHPSTMGVIVHEMGHDLGWPDLYGNSGAGLGSWDIMSYGGWNTAPGDIYLGQTPPLPNAYLRTILGWIDPNNPAQLLPALNFQNAPINLISSTESPFALTLPTDSNPSLLIGEFFIVENRARISYDASLPGSGALVWHINETFPNNLDPQKPRVKLIQADGFDHLSTAANYGDPGDPFSDSSINKSFGVGTPLSSAYSDGTPSNIQLTFGGGSLSGFASIITTQSMAVRVTYFGDVVVNPADFPYAIFLPLAQR